MHLYTKRVFFFKKHIKYVNNIKPFLYGFIFLEDFFKKYPLVSKKYKYFFKQPKKYKRRKYFKYDYYFWLKGPEAIYLKSKISRLLNGVYTGSTFKTSLSTKTAKTVLNNYALIKISNLIEPQTETEWD